MAEQGKAYLICPECGGYLKEVFAEANYGRILLLDQCGRCGGVWFDSWELYHLKEAEAKRLDALDSNNLMAASKFTEGKGWCPRCPDALLLSFKDPNLPADARIDRCAKCSGLWLNRGELIKYTEHKQRMRERPAADTVKKNSEEMPSQENRAQRWETLNRLGAALNARPELNPEQITSDVAGLSGSEAAKDVAFLVLELLLRSIFHI